MLREFKAFLIKQNMLALAIAVVIGTATNRLVQAIVDDFIMPVVGAAAPAGAWQKAAWSLGPVVFKVGDFASVLLNFLIVGFVCWRLLLLFVKEPKESKPAMRDCPLCFQSIDARARRCPHCTSEIASVA